MLLQNKSTCLKLDNTQCMFAHDTNQLLSAM